MTSLVALLDALDTALTAEEVLAIEAPLFDLYAPSSPELEKISLLHKCNEILAYCTHGDLAIS